MTTLRMPALLSTDFPQLIKTLYVVYLSLGKRRGGEKWKKGVVLEKKKWHRQKPTPRGKVGMVG